MGIFKNLFNKKPDNKPVLTGSSSPKNVKKIPFTVEFYPLTGRYYPKYNDRYLQKNYSTGVVESIGDHLFAYADYFHTQEQAEKLITLFREHQLKENVRTIQYYEVEE